MPFVQTYNPSVGFAASSPYTGEPIEVRTNLIQCPYTGEPIEVHTNLILFPGEAHAPGLAKDGKPQTVKKIVVKIMM